MGSSVSRVQLRLPKRSTVRGQPRPIFGLGIAGQTVNGPSTTPLACEGGVWPFQHSFEECTPYLLHILPFGTVHAQEEGVQTRGIYLSN